MPSGRLLVVLCLALVAPAASAPVALAQTAGTTVVPAQGTPNPLVAPATTPDIDAPPPPSGAAVDPGALATTPAETAPAPAPTTPAATAPGAASATPTPPPFLVAGKEVLDQPVSAVVVLTEPAVPVEPLRLAALLAAIIAALAVGTAAALRAGGWRTAAGPPVAVKPRGSISRVRERTAMLADDFRDFLRHSR